VHKIISSILVLRTDSHHAPEKEVDEVPSHQSNRNRIVPNPNLSIRSHRCRKPELQGTPRIALKCRIPQLQDTHNLRNGSPKGNPSGPSSQAPVPLNSEEKRSSDRSGSIWPRKFLMPIAGAFAPGPHGLSLRSRMFADRVCVVV
jgi:hypothetical protein